MKRKLLSLALAAILTSFSRGLRRRGGHRNPLHLPRAQLPQLKKRRMTARQIPARLRTAAKRLLRISAVPPLRLRLLIPETRLPYLTNW